MSKKLSNILVIGGSGFIGSHTSDALSNSGYKVSILDKIKSPWIRKDQKMIIGDTMDKTILDKSMKNIDCIYYFAGIADIEEARANPIFTIEKNIMGLAYALDISVKNKVKKFIYASTMYVYSSEGSFYRATKQAAEILIESYQENFKLDYVFLRYGSLYGPRSQNWNGVRKFVQQILKKGFVDYEGSGLENREYINVKDAANLSIKALEAKYKNMALTITGQQSIKISDMLAMIFEIAGKDTKVNYSSKKIKTFHYGHTPYRYKPKSSIKIIPTEFIDLGEGLLDIIDEVHNSK